MLAPAGLEAKINIPFCFQALALKSKWLPFDKFINTYANATKDIAKNEYDKIRKICLNFIFMRIG